MVIPQYDQPMAVDKFTVSFEPDLAKQVRELAEAEGLSVSAWLADAAERRIKRHLARQLLEEYEAEHGEITEEELEEVRKVWR